jgi:hypothetical protein
MADIPLRFLSSSHDARAVYAQDRRSDSCVVLNWKPPRPDPAPPKNANPTFHEFASDWFATKRLDIGENTASSYGNDLINHLLPFFKDHRISEITVAEVDRYRQQKVREAAEITAATKNGTPITVAYVDRLGRSLRRRARPRPRARSTCTSICWRRSSQSL